MSTVKGSRRLRMRSQRLTSAKTRGLCGVGAPRIAVGGEVWQKWRSMLPEGPECLNQDAW
jgi:hypothetical protein